MVSPNPELPSSPVHTARKRVRNPEAHREAIVAAARSVFGEVGYGAGTIREIARRAGVTHGLVVRHFESKERLFVESLVRSRAERRYTGSAAELPEEMARTYVQRIESDGPNDPFVALIRSVGDTHLATELLEAMRGMPADAFLHVLELPDLEERADLLGALLIGVTFSRYIIGYGTLRTMSGADFEKYLAMAIRGILDGQLVGTTSPP